MASQGASRHKGSAKKKKRYMLFSKKSTFDCYVALPCFAFRFLVLSAALFCCASYLGLPFLKTCLHIPPATNPTKPTNRVPLPDQQAFQQYLRELARSGIRVVLEDVMREELDALIGVGSLAESVQMCKLNSWASGSKRPSRKP